MRFLKGFALAFNMMSIIPFFKVHNFFNGINGYSVMFYPLVGFILGSILFCIQFLLQDIVPSTHLAVIIFSLSILMTGALHIDGLSDTVDGLFVSREKSLQVMKDSHIGGMGMIFTFVFLMLKLSSFIHFEAYYLLPVILMLSRLNALLAIYFYDYMSSGVGQLLKDELVARYLLFAIFYSLALLYIFSFIAALLISLVVLVLIARFFQKRLGGLNGDIYGFIIELSELALLNYVIFTLI
ncbi:MAG: adenosylcobinamide-GDP ribazoletransferase [Campylobacterota bacterium]|nr:adenosylcobinamide-GDP ribazoletransferase [Campylobacterota bacterium]